MIAALFVEAGGVYSGLPDVDAWSLPRDARKYEGPYPIIAHPPCERWGRFWHGSTLYPHQYKLGDDDGCFSSALASLRRFGGVLEHPAQSKAWDYFGILKPWVVGWWKCPQSDLWSCQVDQGYYGHAARKSTWLLYCGSNPPPKLLWGKCPQQIPQWMIVRYGYEEARRIGVIAMIGGKDKKAVRSRTPVIFRDLLISIASNVK